MILFACSNRFEKSRMLTRVGMCVLKVIYLILSNARVGVINKIEIVIIVFKYEYNAINIL